MNTRLRAWLMGLIGLLMLGISLVGPISFAQEDRSREWRDRRREAEALEARIALESRLVKLEEGLAHYNRRLDWIEKIIWGAIIGVIAVFLKDAFTVYLSVRDQRNGRNRDQKDKRHEESTTRH